MFMIWVRPWVGSASDMGSYVNFGPWVEHKRDFVPERCSKYGIFTHGSYQQPFNSSGVVSVFNSGTLI